MDPEDQTLMRAGRCAIVGRPNVGKSTFLNRALGQKLVITTAKPGTTRTAVLGVYVDENTQIAFVDTPGMARARTALHKVLVEEARSSLLGADVVLFMTEAPREKGEIDVPKADGAALQALEHIEVPVLLAINKVDQLKRKERLLPFIAAYQERKAFDAVIPISALKGTQVSNVLDEIRRRLPEGAMYEDDVLTDRPQRFFVAEMIREAVLRHTHGEVPYGCAVFIDKYEESAELDRIHATIVVEKDSHKGIVIGKGGSRLKTIGTEARGAIEALIDRRAHLELWVKVIPGWTSDPDRVRKLATQAEPV